jgi:hypothetical protein
LGLALWLFRNRPDPKTVTVEIETEIQDPNAELAGLVLKFSEGLLRGLRNRQ